MLWPRIFMAVCSRFWLAVVQGPWGFRTRRTRALRRSLRISCTRAACAARASVSMRMAGCSCPPIASARIWSIGKMGHRLVAVGVSAVRSCWGMASSCCRRPGGTATSPSSPWCAASPAAPTARGSRGHGLGARCRLPPTRWPFGCLGAGRWAGGRGCSARLRSPGAWRRRLPGSSGAPAAAG